MFPYGKRYTDQTQFVFEEVLIRIQKSFWNANIVNLSIRFDVIELSTFYVKHVYNPII